MSATYIDALKSKEKRLKTKCDILSLPKTRHRRGLVYTKSPSEHKKTTKMFSVLKIRNQSKEKINKIFL